ncbi:MAG: thiamine pyrophosphate-dependent dehydrogenase E1 component subunit alpha [Miltoncostaeaceae bacterium]
MTWTPRPLPPVADLHRRMYGIRRFEETLLEMFSKGLLVGTTHTCIGQEADAVGVIDHLDPARDLVVSNHRCHGHFLAFTGDRLGLLAEVMGRTAGVSGGRGGSQHLCAPNFYTNGIQGSIVPLTTGMALAQKREGAGGIATVFIGDGTLGQGVVYECLNMASLWELPLLIVVEDNLYAQTTPRALAVAGSVPARAEAFGVAAELITTTDVRQIHAAAGRGVEHIRATGAPYLLGIETYRLAAHSKGDDTRDPAEIEGRREQDPLAVTASLLDPDERTRIESACEEDLARTVELAHAAPVAGVAA